MYVYEYLLLQRRLDCLLIELENSLSTVKTILLTYEVNRTVKKINNLKFINN